MIRPWPFCSTGCARRRHYRARIAIE